MKPRWDSWLRFVGLALACSAGCSNERGASKPGAIVLDWRHPSPGAPGALSRDVKLSGIVDARRVDMDLHLEGTATILQVARMTVVANDAGLKLQPRIIDDVLGSRVIVDSTFWKRADDRGCAGTRAFTLDEVVVGNDLALFGAKGLPLASCPATLSRDGRMFVCVR